MKIKGIMFSGFAAAILMGSAANAATTWSIASKAYVDGQIETVTNSANAVADDVADLQDALGDGFDENSTVADAIDAKADAADVGDVSTITDYENGDTIVSTINGMKTDISGKQDKLSGGTGYEGKVVTAGNADGVVGYTAIDSSIGASGTSNLITSNAVKTYVDNAIDGVTGGGQGIAAQIDAALGSDFTGNDPAYSTVTAALADKQDKSDSTISSAQATAGNHLTAGAGVAGNLVALDSALGTVEGVVGNSTAGLVHDVAGLQEAIGTLPANTDIATELNGKQDTIDAQHKLDADLVDDSSSTNKFVTDTDVTNLATLATLFSGYATCAAGAQSGHCVLSADANGMSWVDVTFPYIENQPAPSGGGEG